MLKKAVIVLTSFVFLLLILIGLVMGAVLEITRQTGLKSENGAAVMLSKSGDVVATASSEQTVNADGSMTVKSSGKKSSRRSTDLRCGGGLYDGSGSGFGSGSDFEGGSGSGSGSGGGSGLAATRRKWGRHGPPSRRELIVQHHGRRSSHGSGSGQGSGDVDGSGDGSGSGSGSSFDYAEPINGNDPFCSDVMDEDPVVQTAINKKTMPITSQVSDKQLKKVATLAIKQGESTISAQVYGTTRLPCEDMLCEMKDPHGQFVRFDTSEGKVDINGHGEIYLVDEKDGGIPPATMHTAGMKTSAPAHNGRRRILAKSRRSGHPDDGMPTVTVEVENVDHEMESQAPVHGIGIKTVDPPETYHIKTVDYKMGNETIDECMAKFADAAKRIPSHKCPSGVTESGVCQDFLGQKITVDLCYQSDAGGYLMVPTGVTETIRVEMEIPANSTTGTPPEKGIFTIITGWDAAYPNQTKYKMVKPNGDSFEAQAVYNHNLGKTQLFHGKFYRGEEIGPPAVPMPTTIEPLMHFDRADEMAATLPHVDDVEKHNEILRKLGRRMMPVYVSPKEMKTRRVRRRRMAGENIITDCPPNPLGTADVQEGCWSATHVSPDGKEEVDKMENVAHSTPTGHVEVPAPVGDGTQTMPVRCFVIESDDGAEIHQCETEACKYDVSGSCTPDPTGKGMPFMTENAETGTMTIIAQATPLRKLDSTVQSNGHSTSNTQAAPCTTDEAACYQKAQQAVDMPKKFADDPFKPFDFGKLEEKCNETATLPAPPLMLPGQDPAEPFEFDPSVVGNADATPAKKLVKLSSAWSKPGVCSGDFKCHEEIVFEGPISFKMESFCDCNQAKWPNGTDKVDEHELVWSKESLDMDGATFEVEVNRTDHHQHMGVAQVRAHVKKQGPGSRALLEATGGHEAPVPAKFLPADTKAAIDKLTPKGIEPEDLGAIQMKGTLGGSEIIKNPHSPKGMVPEPALIVEGAKVITVKAGASEVREPPQPTNTSAPRVFTRRLLSEPVNLQDPSQLEGTKTTITTTFEAKVECAARSVDAGGGHQLVVKIKNEVHTETTEAMVLHKVRAAMQNFTVCTMIEADTPAATLSPLLLGGENVATEGDLCEANGNDKKTQDECEKVGCCQFAGNRCWARSFPEAPCDAQNMEQNTYTIKPDDAVMPAEEALPIRRRRHLLEAQNGVFPGSRRNLLQVSGSGSGSGDGSGSGADRPEMDPITAYQHKALLDSERMGTPMEEVCLVVEKIGEQV